MAIHKLTHKGFTGSCEVSLEDGCLVGRVLFIDDIVTYEGETVPDLKANFEAAVDRYLAYCKRTGKAANKPYSGTFNVRVGADLHRKAVQAAQVAGHTLNEFVSASVSNALTQGNTTRVEHNHRHVVTVEVDTFSQQWRPFLTSQSLENFSGTTIQ